MTTRRAFIFLGLGALAAPLACFGQRSTKVARIGLLDGSPSEARWRDALLAGLRDLGYANAVLEYRSADGKYERLPALAAELIQKKVDVIVAAGANAVKAAQEATSSTPIVMVRIPDPVRSGFVASLARPGRNITGLSNMNADISGKRLELLRAAVPKLSRVTVLVNPANPNHADFLKQIEAAAQTIGIRISALRANTGAEIEAAFEATARNRPEALFVVPDTFLSTQSRRIVDRATQQRLPTMFGIREPVEDGGLMSYGHNNAEHYYRAATYIDKILKGAKPGELPVEQPTKIELVINAKTAKAIGLAIPQQLLLQADKVIE